MSCLSLRAMNKVVIGLGSNLGQRHLFLSEAVRLIGNDIGAVSASSAIYETAAWGMTGDAFLNQVVEANTKLSSVEVLQALLIIERRLGRKRTADGYSSRTLDLDILFFGNEISETENLRIPHPAIAERRFVLIPLVDLDPSYIHPQLKKSVAALLDECSDQLEVKKWPYPTVI
ncbi:MAG: 2-amino-4-hydroxy-6-hydroxymethyldihydropteridine diphosphokinase [Cryomorphaceae bacterium]|nr:2-amino-4-hydroxy-6-hydroxymethyldihydropteridine diphosphokinase [Cryomorphaceae bacterium]